MRFHLGPIPSSPDFHPDQSWSPLKEFSPWRLQLAALPLELAVAISLATLWWVYTPLGELNLSLPQVGFLIAASFAIHEWIHALAHPNSGRTPRTVVGIWPSKGIFYAHYDGPLTRKRFLVIMLLPFAIISLVPLCLAVVLQTAPGWVAFMSVFNGLGSCGDLYGAGMIMAQIPANAVIRNQGWNTYWTSGIKTVRPIGIFQKSHKMLLSLALPALLVVLVYAEEDFRGWHAWQNFKQAAEAQGENLDYASIVPPAVPDDLNFALNSVVATSYSASLDARGHKIAPPNTNVIDRLDMNIIRAHDFFDQPTNGYWAKGTVTHLNEWQAYFRVPSTNRDGTVTNEFPINPKPQSAAEDVLLALSKYDSTIEALRSASHLPYSRFPLNYNNDHPFDVFERHAVSERACVRVLHLRVLAELELGQGQKAVDDVKLALRLVNSLRNQPFPFTYLIRRAQTQLTIQMIYEGLAAHKWSDAQLTSIQAELAKLDFLNDYLFVMRGERNCGLARIEYLRKSRDYEDFIGWNPIDRAYPTSRPTEKVAYGFAAALFHTLPSGWFYLAQADLGDLHQQWMLRAADAKQHQFFPKTATNAANFVEHLPFTPPSVLSEIQMRRLTDLPLKSAYVQSAADMAQIGCALERYRLAEGEYPPSLDSLVPQFITQLPLDVIGGKSLKYHRQNREFVLYSIGWNETDDGGTVGLDKYQHLDIEKGDWVWRYPGVSK